MTTDRPVGLDLGIAQQSTDLSQTYQQTRQDASDTDRRAFEQAMGRDAAATRSDEKKDTPPSPFSLLSGMGAVPSSTVPTASDQDAQGTPRLADTLSEAADRLLVGDGRNGRREVRIDLKDELFPGVSVSVYEEEGRLVAHFTCAMESSRERLCASALALATALAESLSRPTLIRITTDDPEDPYPTEVSCDPGTE